MADFLERLNEGPVLCGGTMGTQLDSLEKLPPDYCFDELNLSKPELVKSVHLSYIRAGADARIPFGPAAIFLGAGYMNIMSAGKFSEMFPHASIGGVDGKLGGSYAIMPWLEARASFTYSRFVSSAKPQGTDAFIAGGALDQYFIGNAGVSAIF